MSAKRRIVDVKYDKRLAHINLTYDDGEKEEVNLLSFGNVPFYFSDELGRRMQRFQIAPDGKSVYFPDMEMSYAEEEVEETEEEDPSTSP